MNENVRGNGSHKFLMFALGTTAGAVVALLTAPRSGKETRRRLRSSLQQVREKASNVSGSLSDSFGRGTEALRDGVINAFDKDPPHASGAQEGSRPAKGTASKSESTSHFNPTTSSSRAGQSYSSSSPK